MTISLRFRITDFPRSIAFRLGCLIWQLGRRLARAMDDMKDDARAVIVLRHSCGSTDVVPIDRWPGWKQPCFECLGCNVLTDRDVRAQVYTEAEAKRRGYLFH